MNSRLSTLLLFAFAAISCGKPAHEKSAATSNTLLGKWRYIEHYFSTGEAGQWHPVQPAGQTVDFKADGSFQSAPSFSTSFQQYEIVDSAKVKFTPAPNTGGFVLMEFHINDKEGTLILTPIEPICFEGCRYKFKRVSY